MAPERARKFRALGILIALGALALASVVFVRSRSHSDAAAPTPPSRVRSSSPAASTSSTASKAAALPVGITFGGTLTGRPAAVVDAALDDVVALHMNWIRIDLSWASLQPQSRSRFSWAATDGIVSAAHARGLHVLGLLTYTPAWARPRGCTTFVCPPRSNAEFAAFAAAVVRRYAPRGVTTYQVWNEPNITAFWRQPNPTAYGALLRASATQIRAAAHDVHLLFGALAAAASVGGNVEPGRFLARACAHATCPVDAVGYDPYTYPELPSTTGRPLNAWQLMTNPTAERVGLRAALPRGVKIWVTQFGAPTRYSGGDDRRLVSESRQARILTDGVRLARQSPGVIGGYFVNTWRDSSTGGQSRDHFGLERVDGTHKAAFAALQKVLAS